MEQRFEMFTSLVSKISRYIRKIKTAEVAEYDLKSPHVSCLYYLYKMNGLTAKNLCDLCEEDKSAISRSIEYLETRGFIVCESNAKKRYKAPFYLTDLGEKVGGVIAEKIDAVLDAASFGISEEERTILYRCLHAISENLQKICEGYGDA